MTGVADLARRLDLPRSRRGYRGRCPVCGNDTLEARERHGHASLVCFYGCAAAELQRISAGGLPVQAPSPVPQRPAAERTEAALAIWRGAADDHPALAAYCAHRSLPGLEHSTALRWRPDVRHPEAEGLYPAMVALVEDVNGQSIAVHRTYTRRDGTGKADLRPAKASKGPIAGGAIRLDGVGPEIVVAEGIETAAAAGRMLDLPAWAGIAAGNIERSMQLPPAVRLVVIASDPDAAGERAANGAARRWTAEGRRVRIIVPDRPGQDFADIYAARVAAGGA